MAKSSLANRFVHGVFVLAVATFGCGEDAETNADASACLEASWIWASCVEGRADHIARRVPLDELCEEYRCPVDWDAAVAAAAACDVENEPEYGQSCWSAGTRCGINLAVSNRGPDPRYFYYDPISGELTGAAVQLTDTFEECQVSEEIAGQQAPGAATKAARKSVGMS
jgi:hypothetical protein